MSDFYAFWPASGLTGNLKRSGAEGVRKSWMNEPAACKRAEEALREMQIDLARANRLTTMGQLAASIAHGHQRRRRLALARPPTTRSGGGAAGFRAHPQGWQSWDDVIGRIRSLVKKQQRSVT